ncbi:apolipoprotein N-acyltransferase [Pseudoduganella armeniaca]|uniref:Apolipoprotein N-acyltransferase n=1 Tax=Pseudoduganella armeniaca TaxID=2072590 RepID=A0A2R4C6R0_9BURK|nr:apolipoprotein N-acyltransferase [Pseudoduganella armeniaca]AVR95306.1 apolipoprotein N-acyltransferase [Pseudoduganella armeniaca]
MRLRRARPGEPSAPPRSTRSRMIIAALAGAASVFSFAPFGWWPLQLLTLALLFYQVLRANSVKASALVGWAFGFGWCVAGVHWLTIVLPLFGLPPALAWVAVVLLSLYLGGHCALAMGAAAWVRQRRALPLTAANLLVLPAFWAISEWTRGWLFTGFPWASSGYAHNVSPLAGYAPVVGVYGIGWLVAVSAGALLLLMHRTRWTALGLVAAIWIGGFALQYVKWTQPVGKPLSVRLIQGNIPLSQKFDPMRLAATLNHYQHAVLAAPADLIAIPETGIPLFPQQLPPGYLDAYGSFARKTGSAIVLGMPMADSPTRYANSVMGLVPAAAKPYRYDKHHLVPFGEFIPPGFRWFTDLMSIPLGDQTRGPALQPALPVKDQRVLPNICYENNFGEEIAAQLNNGSHATVLLNASELAWYGESVAIPQHLQISQMRTLETGRPMLMATNTGATVVIDGRGIVQASLPWYQPGVLAASVQGMTGDTPYIRTQNRLILALAAAAIGAAWLWSRRKAAATA